MKNYIKLIQSGIVMLTLLILASCSTEKSNLTATPKDAGFVMVVDGKALKEKGNINSISESKIYKKAIAEISDDEMADFKQFEYLFKDTKESGIAINEEFIMFMKMVEGTPMVGFNFQVLDKAKVDALFTIVTEKEDDLEVLNSDGVSYIVNDKAIIAWNEAQLLVLAQQEMAPEALLNNAKTLLSQSASESISSNSNYSDFYAKRKDVSFWFNYDLFLDNMPPAQQMMITSQLPFSMKGTFFFGYISFEKGQVVAEYESIMNDEMKAFIKDYQFINDDFDTDVLKFMPKTSYANAEISLNLFDYYHMFLDMYKEKQVDTEVYTKQVEQELGVTVDDLLKSFSGEMAISLHGISMKEETGMSFEIDENGEYKMVEKTEMKPELLYSAVVKYNNDMVWDIIETKAGEIGLVKQDGYYSISQADVYLGYVDNTLLVTNDLELIKKDMADGSIDPNLKSTEVADYLKKFPTYLELNMDLDQYPEEVREYIKNQDKEKSDIFLKFMSTYKRLQVMPTDIYSAKIVLELNNKDKNSLDVILHDLDDASELISKN